MPPTFKSDTIGCCILLVVCQLVLNHTAPPLPANIKLPVLGLVVNAFLAKSFTPMSPDE